MSKGVECRNACAHERRGFHRIERFRHSGQSFHGCDHVFLVASVIAEATYLHVRAIGEVYFPASDARAVLSSMPPHADTVTLCQLLRAEANRVNDAGDLVPRDARI
jgi:hypothetical protein